MLSSKNFSLDEANASKNKPVHSENNKQWETIKGSFIHVALLTNSMGLDDLNAGGLSKYAHLADGSIDLILVNSISRKDLYRFIKRHAKTKDQLDMPFVKAIRVKEARIRILNGEGGGTGEDTMQSSLHNFYVERDNNMIQQQRAAGSNKQIDHFVAQNSNLIRRNGYGLTKSQNLSDDDEKNEGKNENEQATRAISKKPPISARSAVVSSRRGGSMRNGPTDTGVGMRGSNRKDSENAERPPTEEFIKQNSLMRKSKSIVNFLKENMNMPTKNNNHNRATAKSVSSMHLPNSAKANDNSNNADNEDFDSIDDEYYDENMNDMYNNELSIYDISNNFNSSESLKVVSVWSCDWHLNNLPYMHMK